jgi:Domain of unknown function (DUF1330)
MTTRSQIGLALLAGFVVGAAAVQGLHAAGSAVAISLSPKPRSRRRAGLVAAGRNIVVYEGPSPVTRVAINAFDSLNAAQAWRNSDQFKEARKVADKYAKFRSFAIEGLPQ